MKNITILAGLLAVAPFISIPNIFAAPEASSEEVAKAKTSTPEGWTDNLDLALKQAAKEGKHILVDFSGSDWCGWCIRLDKEVFSKQEFKDGAKDKFILVFIDRPRDRNRLSEHAQKNNNELIKKYEVRGFPTVLIMDPNGKVLGKTGYRPGGPVKYLEHLGRIVRGEPEPVEKTPKPRDTKKEPVANSTPKGWTDNLDAAFAQAEKEGKFVLVDFSGSDWCGWCKRLDKEVFSQDAFLAGAKDKFVLTFIDSPRDQDRLSEHAKKNNTKLVQKYNVRGFPSVFVLSPDGEIIGTTGYRQGGPAKYLEHLNELIESGRPIFQLRKDLKKLPYATPEERAKLIDSVFSKLSRNLQIENESFIQEILNTDKDGKLGLREHYPFFTDYVPFENTIQKTFDGINNEIRLAINQIENLGQASQEAFFAKSNEILIKNIDKVKALKAQADEYAKTCHASIKDAYVDASSRLENLINHAQKRAEELRAEAAKQAKPAASDNK